MKNKQRITPENVGSGVTVIIKRQDYIEARDKKRGKSERDEKGSDRTRNTGGYAQRLGLQGKVSSI